MGVVTTDDPANSDARYFNSAVLLGADGKVLGLYDKVYLLLFGEHLPFADDPVGVPRTLRVLLFLQILITSRTKSKNS